MDKLIEEYRDVYNVHCLEGYTGVSKFARFCRDLGYRAGMNYDSDILCAFLADNPGATQALFDWIVENECQDWVENIESCLPEKEDEPLPKTSIEFNENGWELKR